MVKGERMRLATILFATTSTFFPLATEAVDIAGLATLKMTTVGLGKSLGASFVSVDGKNLARWLEEISVAPGKHKIGYVCVVEVDGPPMPSTTMNFEVGKVYEFACPTDGTETATVRVQ
jgi:hypothetical protein